MQDCTGVSSRIFLKLLSPSLCFWPKIPHSSSNECFEAFYRIKEALITTPIIQSFEWSLPVEIMCDASDYVVGAILGQQRDKKPYVIYYASKTLDEAQ